MMFAWIFIIIILLFSTKALTGKNNQGSQSNNTAEILKQRYARGEISREEFLRMQKTLNGTV